MANKYRISLNVAGLTVSVNPVFDRLSIQEERPEGEAFLRSKLDTELIFHRGDFDYLSGLTIDQEVIIYVEQLQNNGSYEVKYTGVFTKTDCTWNEDDKTCKVKPRTRDDYEKILQGLNKELNLIDLMPEITPVSYVKKPVIQAYLFDSDVVANFQQGNYWETPVIASNVNAVTLVNDYYFAVGSDFIYIPGDETLSPDVSGKYSVADGYREDGLYRLVNESGKVAIEIAATGVNVYEGVTGEAFINAGNWLAPAGLLTSLTSSSAVQGFRISVYLRYYTDKTNIAGVPTFDVPENDIVSSNSNYTHVIGLNADNIKPYAGHSVTPTPFGKFSESSENFANEYFELYPSAGSEAVYPASKSAWQYYSLWFQFDSFLTTIEDAYSTTVTLTDAYQLHDVIDAYLNELAPTITHSNTADYSQFFYDDSNNPIRTKLLRPLLTPKSNVLVGNYDQPAKKAPLRFGELLQFLKDFYSVYWFIRDGMLILEHIEYFERGGSYTTNQIGANLTTDLEPKTAKAWGYRTNQYTYEKTDMPERIEYNWMDPQSPVFEGYPIEMLDNRVDKGNVQGRNFAKFSADIDYISTAPDEITKTGFVWMETEQQGQGFFVPTAPITFEGLNLNIQNGYASLTFALDEYQKYQLPCTNVKINGEVTTAESVIKTKIQEVFFPMNPVEDNLLLVTTGIGSGKLKTREINLLNGIVKMILKHDQ